MPQPTERSQKTGRARVYWKQTPQDSWEDVTSRWACLQVAEGSREQKSTAIVEFNRADYLRNPTEGEPTYYQDTQFAVVWQPLQNPGGTILFHGTPVLPNRKEIGAEGASSTIGTITLRHAAELYAQHPDSQIIGAAIPQILDAAADTGDIIEDQSATCVFNPDGEPNRSVQTELDCGLFGGGFYQPYAVHYFVNPGGFDIDTRASTGTDPRLTPRFWTYAQAIAYLLSHYCADDGQDTDGTLRNVTINFGLRSPGGDATQTDTVWAVVAAFLDLEPPGEEGEAPIMSNFTTDIQRLLTAKVPGIDVTGMTVIDALAKLLTQAGLGWWIDTRQELPSVDTMVDQVTHTFRVWSPGGTLNPTGVGELFTPRLEPHFTSQAERAAADLLFANNVRDIDVRWDYTGIINQPIVKRAPTLWEITVQLRPMWLPLIGGDDGAKNAYFDNINLGVDVTDGLLTGGKTQEAVAYAEGMLALLAWASNPEAIHTGTLQQGIMRRVKFIAKALHLGGEFGQFYYDVGRKWGIPTDWSYPTSMYGRDDLTGIPSHWQDYRPVNFESDTDILTNPIPDAATWPTRARPFLPTVHRNASGQYRPPIVEISFDSGDNWTAWGSVRVSQSESALWLTYDNPFNVINPRYEDGESKMHNLFQAFVNNRFRVRVTCSIQGSDATTADVQPFQVDELARAQVFDRTRQYGKTVLLSRFQDDVVQEPTDLTDHSDASLTPDVVSSKTLLHKPVDDLGAMLTTANAVRTYYSDPRVTGNLTIPWVEMDARPGQVVPRVDDGSAGGPINNGTQVPRGLDFETVTIQGERLAPHIAGVVHNFRQGEFSTQLALDDWRSLLGNTERL